jgi:translation initiation factor IF-2
MAQGGKRWDDGFCAAHAGKIPGFNRLLMKFDRLDDYPELFKREVFNCRKFGAIAGCMVSEGYVKRNLPIRVLRDNVVIYEGQLESLRRFKDDVAEVKSGFECGIGFEHFSDVKTGDIIEAYIIEKIQPTSL